MLAITRLLRPASVLPRFFSVPRVAVPLLNVTRSKACFSTAQNEPTMHGTTIVCVRKGDKVVMIGDGQVTFGDVVLKDNAKKVRLLSEGAVICGFSGSTADAFTLVEMLDEMLKTYPGQLMRCCVDVAKKWRTDRYLRHLNAHLICADREITLLVDGTGNVVESSDVTGTGSGGHYAIAAARALHDTTELSAEQVARKAMEIASDMCIYTNKQFQMLSIPNTRPVGKKQPQPAEKKPTQTPKNEQKKPEEKKS